MSIQEIIQGLNSKRITILDPLFALYGKRIYDKVYASLLSEEQARQIVREVFLYVFRHGAEISSEYELVQMLEGTADKACIKKLLDDSLKLGGQGEMNKKAGGEIPDSIKLDEPQNEEGQAQGKVDLKSGNSKNMIKNVLGCAELCATVALLIYVLITFKII